jgi:Magnesium chelatase, subunit ChlI
VTLARSTATDAYPARFTLVAAMNPCPYSHGLRSLERTRAYSARPMGRPWVTSASVRDPRGSRPPSGQHERGEAARSSEVPSLPPDLTKLSHLAATMRHPDRVEGVDADPLD